MPGSSKGLRGLNTALLTPADERTEAQAFAVEKAHLAEAIMRVGCTILHGLEPLHASLADLDRERRRLFDLMSREM